MESSPSTGCERSSGQVIVLGASCSRQTGNRRLPAGAALAAMALALLLALLLPAVQGLAAAEHPAPGKRILILDSHQQGLPIPDGVITGILSVLREHRVSVADVFIEHLDLLRFPTPEHKADQVRYLQQKLAGQHLDLIITVTTPALQFLLDEGKDLFAGVPVLATIVPEEFAKVITPRKLAILPWRLDSAGTLRLALGLFPKTRGVVVITGAHDEFLPYLPSAQKDFAPWKDTLAIEYTSDLTYAEMLKRVSSLPPDHIVLYAPYFADKTGQSYIPAEVAARVGTGANAPVFAMVDIYIRDRVIGGSVLTSKDIGTLAGGFAHEILNGKRKLTEQTTLLAPYYIPLFDWKQTELRGGKLSSLPANTVFLNRPQTIWNQYKKTVLAAAAVFILLLLLVTALLILNKRRKAAEKNALANEARFRALLEHAPEAIMIYDLDEKRIVEANPEAERLFDRDRQTLTQGGPERFYAPEQPDQMPVAASMATHNRQALAGETAMFERVITRPSGERRFCETRLTMLPYRDRRQIRASFIDVTARKQTEQRLAKAQSYIASILDSMPSVVVGVDPDGTVTHWNKAAETHLGFTAEQAVGRHMSEMPPRLAVHAEDVVAAIEERQPRTSEREPFSVSEGMRHQDVVIYPLFIGGIEGAVIRLDDVTDRVRLEEMMIQTEKMTSVGGLAAGMAHEINNPLSAILQSAQMALLHLDPDTQANIKQAEACGSAMQAIRCYAEERKLIQFLDGIREAGSRAAFIVKNMLEFSRRSAAGREPADINSILDKAIELSLSDYDLKKKYDFKQITIERDYAADLPAIPCSRTEIEQVILNLLKNAAQAMTGQSGTSRPPTISMRTALQKDGLRIDIEDNGPGMPPHVRKRIFEPFYTTKSVGEGTGLGLAVSYFIIVTNHRGHMEVQSEPGKGTRFTITLPLE